MTNIYRPICLPGLKKVVTGQENLFSSSHGNIYYITAGKGDSVLFVHGINAGASTFEWRNNFDCLAEYFNVYALELPGFARSNKRPIPYLPQIYIKVISEFINEVIGSSVNIVSSGLSAAYCSYLAYIEPQLISSMVLITPSGIKNNASLPCESSFTSYNIFTSPIQGDGIYNAFVSRPSIEYFLKRFIYYNPASVSAFDINYTFQAAHQCPHAKYAPASFIAGLSNLDISLFWPEIKAPILLIWGAQARLNIVDNLKDFIRLNPEIFYYIFPDCGLIPQVEKAEELNLLMIYFFKYFLDKQS